MKVFKFGGASVRDADRIRNVAAIIGDHAGHELLVVISALGKTTNALEDVVVAFYQKDLDKAESKISSIEDNHLEIARSLFKDERPEAEKDLKALFDTLRKVPQSVNSSNFNLLYDQVVSIGELLSTKLVSHYLQYQKVKALWQDVREILKTDQAYREAKVNWKLTEDLAHGIISPLLKENVIITQGFIGRTSDNFTTTLGREGSDFTAAVFSYILDAEELVIWKDVIGVLNANPTLFNDTTKINHLTYEEAVEMTFYGAQVIHPKTIKPLQNKGIPLHVRSFIEKETKGTIVSNEPLKEKLPPIIVFKRNQVLIQLSTKDFSFMAEENLVHIYNTFSDLRIDTNIMQNGAITLSVCIDNIPDKMSALQTSLSEDFSIHLDDSVEVLTIRHYHDDIVQELTGNKEVLIVQKTPETVQYVIKAS